MSAGSGAGDMRRDAEVSDPVTGSALSMAQRAGIASAHLRLCSTAATNCHLLRV